MWKVAEMKATITKLTGEVEVLHKMIARQSILLKAAQKSQSVLDSHHIAKHDPNYTDYPINSYVFFTALTGQGDKLELA